MDKTEVTQRIRPEQTPGISYTNGIQFLDGWYTKSPQYKAYVANLDAIHAEAVRMLRAKGR